MEINWKKAYSDRLLYRIEIAKAVLADNDIDAVVVNKQDSAYLFGEIELYVPQTELLKAINIINKISYE
ncbi:MAG: hypothetical protein ACPG5B_05675 [Chitinophagales bacterium]